MAVIPFFVGSYSMPSPWAGAPEAHGAGIVIADLDTDSGAVHVRSSHYEINPSFLVRSGPDGLLWAITEPEKGGEVVAFREDAACGLDLVGRLDTGAVPRRDRPDVPARLRRALSRRLSLDARV
jgi:6-phosphogluconolactonase (cycloisomerase 2 family)